MTLSAALVRFAAPTLLSTDAELLRAFVAARRDDAFAELVRRHGPMILAACRRVLGDADEAEDAFQATFLVLARKAESIRGTNLAGWLYGVAVRTARGVRLMRDRRRKRERLQAHRPPTADPGAPDTELAQLVDEELAKLPDHSRAAVVLCELRGLSRREAAAELGIPEGTLSSRLAAAKRKLAAALIRRGVVGAAALTALLAPAPISASLLKAATAVVRGPAGRMADAAAAAVLKGMLFDQLRTAALTAGLLVTVACGGLAMSGAADSPGTNAPAAAPSLERLVEQLGSTSFTEREAAEKALKELGGPARPAVLAGLKSADPEIVRRCEALLPALRHTDWLRARAAFAGNPDSFDHPVRTKIERIAGDGADARSVLAEVLADEQAFVALDEVIEHPKSADRLYRQAVARLVREWNERQQADPKNRPARPGGWRPDPGAYAGVLLLGALPGTNSEPVLPLPAGSPYWMKVAAWEPCLAGIGDGTTPPSPALQKLFVAWLGARTDPDAVSGGLNRLCFSGGREALPLARAVAADAHRPVRVRASALVYLGIFGTVDDAPLAAALFADATEYWPGGTGHPVLVCDVATAVALRLHGLDPFDFGFFKAREAVARRGLGLPEFDGNVTRDSVLRKAQGKVRELSADRLAPPPRAKP
jgi:RNA polymerase sigma factor (sigma-70 family)